MKILFFSISFAYSIAANAQTNCDSLSNSYYQVRADKIGFTAWDTAPKLLSDRGLLTVKQDTGEPIGEVFAQFFIMQDGLASCITIVGTTDARLQIATLNLMHKLKFSPARVAQTYVPASMTLRISFIGGN